MRDTVRGALALHDTVSAAGRGPFRAVPLPRPDMNIVRLAVSHPALGLVAALGFPAEAYHRAGGLAVVRCTVMDPFLALRRGRTDYLQDFVATLRRVFEAELAGGG